MLALCDRVRGWCDSPRAHATRVGAPVAAPPVAPVSGRVGTTADSPRPAVPGGPAASSGSSPYCRLARRWRSRSQHWSRWASSSCIRARCSSVCSLRLAQLVLLVHEIVDAAEDVLLVHGRDPAPATPGQTTSGTQPSMNAASRRVTAPPARPTASSAARSSGTRTSRRPVSRVTAACPPATRAGHGCSSCGQHAGQGRGGRAGVALDHRGDERGVAARSRGCRRGSCRRRGRARAARPRRRPRPGRRPAGAARG